MAVVDLKHICVAAVALLSMSAARAQETPDRLARWLAAIAEHAPGNHGKAALDVAEWTGADLELVIVNAKRHARSLGRTRQDEANEMLLRGAALHSDIANLIPQNIEQQSKKQRLIFLVEDGREQGTRYVSIHWELGRSLLDSVTPTPAAHPGVLQWYQQTSKDLLQLRSLAEALLHLSKARRIFPTDPDLLFMSGVLHERLSSPALQAAAEEVEADNTKLTSLDTARAELARAEQLFKDLLAVQPDNLEARVRHGRVLGRLGRHRQSADVLREAIRRGVSGEFLYLAEMFLGTEEEALGNHAEARLHFARAASLYPRAQSPRLALSQLSRRVGDRAGAQRELGALAELPADEGRREDPWWNYYDYRCWPGAPPYCGRRWP